MKIATVIACAATALSSIAFGSVFGVGYGPEYKVHPKESMTLRVKAAADITSNSTNLSVMVDLGPLGGGIVKLNDKGGFGDDMAGDGTYTLKTLVPSSARPGRYDLKFIVLDGQGNSYVSTLAVSVTDAR